MRRFVQLRRLPIPAPIPSMFASATKEGLFSAIVEPALHEMLERFIKIQEQFHQMTLEKQAVTMPEYADGGTAELVDYMYEHLDEFRLLLDASYGTRFHNFVDELVRIEVEYTYKYMEAVGYAGKAR